jgi:hypothetical protein
MEGRVGLGGGRPYFSRALHGERSKRAPYGDDSNINSDGNGKGAGGLLLGVVFLPLGGFIFGLILQHDEMIHRFFGWLPLLD